MNVTLRELSIQNLQECVDLETNGDHHRFVSSNVLSIAQSKVAPYLVPRAIYAGDQMVGFAMHGRVPRTGRYYVVRLMIAVPDQGKGYGKAAMRALIDELSQLDDCKEIYLSIVPENSVAEQLYTGLGFVRTGEVDEDGEVIMKLSL